MNKNIKVFHADKTSYFALLGFWYVFLMWNIYVIVMQKGVVEYFSSGNNTLMILTALLITVGGTICIRGFRMEFTPTSFIYRDWLYRVYKIDINDIDSAKNDWVEVGRIRKSNIPRFVIKHKDKQYPPILVNTKFFTLKGVTALNKIIGVEIEDAA